MSIFITGDTHARLDDRFNYLTSVMREKDVLIVLGDLGFSWNEMTELLWKTEDFPFITFSVLGNHENYHRIYNLYEEVEIFGGKAYKLSDGTYYAKNGEMYEIEGKKFFVFGGAVSIDKDYRTPGLSWWPEEIPTKADYNHALEVLEENNWTFNYLLTHTCEDELSKSMFGYNYIIPDTTANMIQQLKFEIKFHNGKFSKHFFGHHHQYSTYFGVDFDVFSLYNEVYNLDTGEVKFFKGNNYDCN